jgi:hypothetical protein
MSNATDFIGALDNAKEFDTTYTPVKIPVLCDHLLIQLRWDIWHACSNEAHESIPQPMFIFPIILEI